MYRFVKIICINILYTVRSLSFYFEKNSREKFFKNNEIFIENNVTYVFFKTIFDFALVSIAKK